MEGTRGFEPAVVWVKARRVDRYTTSLCIWISNCNPVIKFLYFVFFAVSKLYKHSFYTIVWYVVYVYKLVPIYVYDCIYTAWVIYIRFYIIIIPHIYARYSVIAFSKCGIDVVIA